MKLFNLTVGRSNVNKAWATGAEAKRKDTSNQKCQTHRLVGLSHGEALT